MRHRADIERDGAGTDPWGNKGSPIWGAHLAGVRCFTWSMSRKEAVDEDKTAVLEVLKCIMPLGTDVTERDRIAATGIRDRAGTTILAGPLVIEAVQRHTSHLELTLERVNG